MGTWPAWDHTLASPCFPGSALLAGSNVNPRGSKGSFVPGIVMSEIRNQRGREGSARILDNQTTAEISTLVAGKAE